MKALQYLIIPLLFILPFQSEAFAQADRATDHIKKYINETVQKVEKADNADEKREILNTSFDKLLKAIDRVESMNRFSKEEQAGLAALKENITEKQHELNGLDGFDEVQDEELDDFSNYVQQDMEQAQNRYITISISTALLIILILLLL